LQFQGERSFLVGEEVPAEAVKDAAFDGRDGDAFGGEFFRLPGLTAGTPAKDGVVADEEEQTLRGKRANLEYWAIRNHGEAFGGGGANDVGVAAGDGADFFRVGSGPEAGGDGRVAEAEGAGGQEGLHLRRVVKGCAFPDLRGETWGTRRIGADEDFEGAAFHFFGIAWVDEVTGGQDKGARGEDFGLPVVRKGADEQRRGHGFAS